eukprot:scaffold7878_cov126-Isochrysis_galbana.AAC.11
MRLKTADGVLELRPSPGNTSNDGGSGEASLWYARPYRAIGGSVKPSTCDTAALSSCTGEESWCGSGQ